MEQYDDHFKFGENVHVNNSYDDNGNGDGDVEFVGGTDPAFTSYTKQGKVMMKLFMATVMWRQKKM